jgi:hypothetical protein
VQEPEARRAVIEAAAQVGARVVAGARPADLVADGEREGQLTLQNARRRERTAPPAEDELVELGPYEDIMARVSAALDPAGLFRERG